MPDEDSSEGVSPCCIALWGAGLENLPLGSCCCSVTSRGAACTARVQQLCRCVPAPWLAASMCLKWSAAPQESDESEGDADKDADERQPKCALFASRCTATATQQIGCAPADVLPAHCSQCCASRPTSLACRAAAELCQPCRKPKLKPPGAPGAPKRKPPAGPSQSKPAKRPRPVSFKLEHCLAASTEVEACPCLWLGQASASPPSARAGTWALCLCSHPALCWYTGCSLPAHGLS